MNREFTVREVVDYLNEAQVRATYGAVGKVVGMGPNHVPGVLGPRRPWASWVVSSESGNPTGYAPEDIHPQLKQQEHVISSSDELLGRLREYYRTRPRQGA